MKINAIKSRGCIVSQIGLVFKKKNQMTYFSKNTTYSFFEKNEFFYKNLKFDYHFFHNNAPKTRIC